MINKKNGKRVGLLLATILTGSLAMKGYATETDYSFTDDYSKEQLLELDRVIHAKLNNIAGNTISDEQPISVEYCAITQDNNYNYLDVKIRNNGSENLVEGVSLYFQILDEQGDSLEDKSLWFERVDAGQGVTSSLWIDGNLSTPVEDIVSIKFFEVYVSDTQTKTAFEVPYVFDGSGNDTIDTSTVNQSMENEETSNEEVAESISVELEPNFIFHTEAVSVPEDEAKYETLSVGSSGDAVLRMQEELATQGFLATTPDGQFGNNTKASVTSFQESVGLTATGDADSVTLEILYGEYVEPEVDVEAALQEQTWLFNGGENTILNGISFSDNVATVAQVYFDGNGKHDNDSTACAYKVSEGTITLTMVDGTEMEIPYEVKNGQLCLNNGEWMTISEVKAGLQGNWECRYLDDFTKLSFEYRATIAGDTFSNENANSNGYYFGPYEGAYTLNFGGFDADFMHSRDWYYNIIDGEVVLLHYERILSRAEQGLKGQYGYSF